MIITDDGIRLNARLDMPVVLAINKDGAAKCPIMIIIHGFTGHMEEAHLNALSDALNEAGYATLRADMYGHGKSEGSFREHTLFKWMTNAMTLIDYARGLDFVTDIYLCGHSQGGLTAILAAGLKHDVHGGSSPSHILGCPFCSPSEVHSFPLFLPLFHRRRLSVRITRKVLTLLQRFNKA